MDLAKGDPIIIENGPFVGYEAIFDLRLPDSDRVQVFPEDVERSAFVVLKWTRIKLRKQSDKTNFYEVNVH